MRHSFKTTAAITFAAAALSACAVIPVAEEPVMEAPVVVVAPPPPPSCYEVSALQRVEIPAETKTVTAVSLIENPPYEPIEQSTSQEIVTKQAEVFYVLVDPATGNQTEVTNLCPGGGAVVGPVGPAPGDLLNGASGG